MSKHRFIFMSLLPNIVFGFLPYMISFLGIQYLTLAVLGVIAIGMGAGDYYNVFNALIAIAVGLELDISLEDIKKGIQEFELTKNRMDILEKNHKTVIDGTYNASVDSMKSSIDVLANYKKRKVAILADMLELGDYSQQLHEEVGSYVASKGIDILVCVGKEAKYIYQKARESMKDVYYFESNQEVIARLDELLKEDDVILVKGSHSMNLKEVVEKI